MRLLVCALEVSSNIHLKELKKYLNEDIELFGIFDKKLGVPDFDITSMAIMGFADAIAKLPYLFGLNNKIVKLANNADKILLMDSSGFNLPLAKKIKAKYPSKEIIYYILPQAWAWKKKRIIILEKNCDKLLSIIPFEKDFYSINSKIKYVGHPLLDEISVFKKTITITNNVVFMPGSRKGEIEKLMPIYREVAKKIEKKSILVVPSHFSKDFIKNSYGDISLFTISFDAHDSLIKADFAFICSGTATLEAALIGTPFVLNYIAKPFDYFIAKHLVKIKYIGLANIFFDKIKNDKLHEEFIQDRVNIKNLLNEYSTIDHNKFLRNSKILREYLKHGSSKNVADIINNKVPQ